MPRFPLLLAALLLLPSGSANQQGVSRQKPVGIPAADEQMGGQAAEPSLPTPRRQINKDQVTQEAAELRKLADTVPDGIHQVTEGQLPKDLSENLKRIEKLAKHLRSEISP
ncbi:MAG: hypothetical protein WA192_01385 [Candidatus Acidiferrales bacterium]